MYRKHETGALICCTHNVDIVSTPKQQLVPFFWTCARAGKPILKTSGLAKKECNQVLSVFVIPIPVQQHLTCENLSDRGSEYFSIWTSLI